MQSNISLTNDILESNTSICANFNMNLTYKNTIFLAIYYNLLSCSEHYTVTIKFQLVLKHTSVPGGLQKLYAL